jgi:hypothetical protein
MEELLVYVLGWILQFLGEVLLNSALEVLAELLKLALKEPLRGPEQIKPAVAILGYMVYGALAGGLSLLAFPHHMVHNSSARLAGLFVIPLLTGLVMGGLGALRRRQDKEVIRLESFVYAFFFALGTALVRLIWAR